MRWLVDTFYLQPLNVGFLVIAAYGLVAVWLLPRGARQAQKAASAVGLKLITLSSFLHYINYPEKVPGSLDLSVIRESEAERAYAMYVCAKGMFVMLPALVAILLVGYGYKTFTVILIAAFLLFYALARARYHKYRGIYP